MKRASFQLCGQTLCEQVICIHLFVQREWLFRWKEAISCKGCVSFTSDYYPYDFEL